VAVASSSSAGEPPAQSLSGDQTMLAAVIHGPRDLRLERRPIPIPATDEILIKVQACRVSRADSAEWLSGSLTHAHGKPLILGHQLTGYVAATGSAAVSFRRGEPVLVGGGDIRGDLLNNDGRLDRPSCYFAVGLERDGGFAQYCVAAADECFLLKGVQPTVAAFAHPMAIAIHALRRSRLCQGERVAVLGLGCVGLLAVASAVSQGAAVLAADPDEVRVQAAIDLGASEAVVRRFDRADMLMLDREVIIESAGTRDGSSDALRHARPHARVVILEEFYPARDISLADLRGVSRRELELIGSHGHDGSPDLEQALAFLAARPAVSDVLAPQTIGLRDLVDHDLSTLIDRSGFAFRTLIDPWQEP
jgi:(R,R)-butanediol dehydrogenase / meso-butanediol dehydrogenase / diacetyl reductase